jgi:hypothetical protein
MAWFVISTFDDDRVVTWSVVEPPFATLDDASEAIDREMAALNDSDDPVNGMVHVIEAKSKPEALELLDLTG